MTHLTGSDRAQTLLLPESLDDYVGADNPVRFIDAFVDKLNLAAADFARVAPRATGRPGYHPADLLKLYIYGYQAGGWKPKRTARTETIQDTVRRDKLEIEQPSNLPVVFKGAAQQEEKGREEGSAGDLQDKKQFINPPQTGSKADQKRP